VMADDGRILFLLVMIFRKSRVLRCFGVNSLRKLESSDFYVSQFFCNTRSV